MSLDNLFKIGRLKAHAATPAELSDLLAAADRNLADARVGAISVENIEFLYSKNRLNVALSRARCLSLLIANPALMAVRCTTPEQMALVNTLYWVREYSAAH